MNFQEEATNLIPPRYFEVMIDEVTGALHRAYDAGRESREDELQALKGVAIPGYESEIERLRRLVDLIPSVEEGRDYEKHRADAAIQAKEKAEARGDLHARINDAVAKALGQDFGESWHDLGEKVVVLRSKLAAAEVKIEALERTQAVCQCGTLVKDHTMHDGHSAVEAQEPCPKTYPCEGCERGLPVDEHGIHRLGTCTKNTQPLTAEEIASFPSNKQ